VSAERAHYEEVQAGLESARGRIRSLLGQELGWRVTPELRFHLDTSIDEAERIARALIDAPETLQIPKDEEGYPL
jgi:ribosome-binding factor A